VDSAWWVRACLGVADYDCALEYMSLTVDQVEGGFRSSQSNAFAVNLYRDPLLERPEFVELRKQLGYPLPGL
jgi:hypothetical protein